MMQDRWPVSCLCCRFTIAIIIECSPGIVDLVSLAEPSRRQPSNKHFTIIWSYSLNLHPAGTPPQMLGTLITWQFSQCFSLIHESSSAGAIEDFSVTIEAVPAYGDAWMRRGQARAALGEDEDALVDLARCLSLSSAEPARQACAVVSSSVGFVPLKCKTPTPRKGCVSYGVYKATSPYLGAILLGIACSALGGNLQGLTVSGLI